MGDTRYSRHLQRFREAGDKAAVLRVMADDEVVQALAAASHEQDPLLANVLATEALNRMGRNRIITTHLAEGAFAVDADGILTFVNPAMAQILGGTWRDYVGRASGDALQFEALERPAPADGVSPVRVAMEDRSVQRWEGRLAGMAHEPVPVSLVVAPILSETGGPIEGAVGAFRDLRMEERAEATLRTILEQMPSGVVVADPQGDVQFSNEALARILRLPRERAGPSAARGAPELRVKGPGGAVPPAPDWPLARALEGARVMAREFELEREDGSWTWLNVHAAPVRDATGRILGAVSLFDDIGQRKALQFESERARARLEGVIDSMAEGLVIFQADGAVYLVNPAAQRILGVTPEEARARHPSESPIVLRTPEGDVIPPHSTPAAIALRERRPVTGVHVIVENPGKGRKHLLVNVVPLEGNGAVANFEDVTSQVEAQERIAESEERYRCLYDLNPQGIFTLDQIGKVTGVNRAGALLLAYEEHEIVGQHFLTFLLPGQEEDAQARFLHVLQGEIRHDEYRLRRKDGTSLRARITGVPMSVRGEIVGMHGIAEVLD